VSSELLRENQKYTKGPSIVTPNFVDFELFSPKQEYLKDPSKVRFVYIGRLESEKGMETLLDTLQLLKEREDFVFRIVGWGTYLPEMLSATRKGLHVEYWGKVSHDEIPEIIADSDVLVLPSLTEGMPAVILESLASGTPVIASSVGQIPIVVQDGIEGILVKPGDSQSLRNAIEKILNNKGLVTTMGKAARPRVERISGGYVRIHRKLYERFVPKLKNTGQ
ncbi:MAG: glycosyltransferase family 4 protein, partial [Candidatus Thorarchaeota archaeon]